MKHASHLTGLDLADEVHAMPSVNGDAAAASTAQHIRGLLQGETQRARERQALDAR